MNAKAAFDHIAHAHRMCTPFRVKAHWVASSSDLSPSKKYQLVFLITTKFLMLLISSKLHLRHIFGGL